MSFLSVFLLILSFSTFCFPETDSVSKPYNAIFSFGNSLADTGNLIAYGSVKFSAAARPPYGETYFHQATGRCSDGRLIVDFIAEAYGMPLVPPYLGRGEEFEHGANFAVAGSTALEAKFFYDRNIRVLLWTDYSLRVQLGWFKELKSSICTRKAAHCNDYFGKSLFLVGPIGGDDYRISFIHGNDNKISLIHSKSIKEARALVPLVVQAIATATTVLIEEGAVELVVPGSLPLGCLSMFLTIFPSLNGNDYDRNGCLKVLNNISKYHNRQLKIALEKLRQKHPHAKIIYADYYGAAERFIYSPKQFGFTNGALKSCCGAKGLYNFSMTARCGQTGSTTCPDPSTYVNWDGLHLTEAAYQHIASGLLKGTHSYPPMRSPLRDIPLSNTSVGHK